MTVEQRPTIRLDKWLWHARFAKSRGLAAKMIEAGAVRVNASRVVKPATPVRVGDGLSFALAGQVRALRILGLGLRRGPAPEARQLYEELGPATLVPDTALEPVRQADK